MAVVLCDFTQILGDGGVTIGDADNEWEASFNTGGREPGSPAFLLFNVRGLTHTDVDVPVEINGSVVGTIRRYPGEETTRNYWFTQMIAVDGATLNNGNNTIRIEAVSWPGASPGHLYDNFNLKNVVCFFHQQSS